MKRRQEPRRFKVCARPFFDIEILRYGRCDRRAGHMGSCEGTLYTPGTTEAKALRAEHVRLAAQEDAEERAQ